MEFLDNTWIDDEYEGGVTINVSASDMFIARNKLSTKEWDNMIAALGRTAIMYNLSLRGKPTRGLVMISDQLVILI
jgi:hypothetical protein